MFLLCVLFFSHSDVYASVDWTTNLCGTSGTITISDNVEFKCMQVIPDGVTVTINGSLDSDGMPMYSFWNKLYLDSQSTISTNAWCMFSIEPGGTLIINNMDINGNAHHTYSDSFDFAGTNESFRIGVEPGWEDNADYRPLPYGAFHNSGHLELHNCKVHDIVSKQFYIGTDEENKKRQERWRGNGTITIASNPLGRLATSVIPSDGKSLYTKLVNCKFYENIFYSGSVIYTRHLNTGAGATNKIYIENCEIYHNVQRECNSLEGNRWGGIIRTEGSSKAEITLKNTTIRDNFANGECSGVFFNAKNISFDGCTITGNRTEWYGGGLRLESDCTFTGSPTTISGNYAKLYGGGIHFYGYAAGGYSEAVDWTYDINSNMIVTDNEAGEKGGGIAFDFTAKTKLPANSTITANINGCTIENNTAGLYGGGIYAVNNTDPAKNYKITINLNAGNIGKENDIYYTRANKANTGGGIYIDGMDISSNQPGAINVTCNKADYRGGGIYSNNGNVTFMGNLNLTHNVADPYYSGENPAAGGGLCIEGGSLTVNNATVKNNESRDGGGIYAGGGCKVTITEGNISGNTSPNGWGAGLRVNDSTVELKNGDIEGNNCTYKAGGICLINSTMKITGSGTIKQNTSGEDGAGVFAQNSEFTMNSGTISWNEAANSGAGIFAQNSTVTVNNGTISGNTANISGGGIYFELTEAVEKTLKFGGGEIKNNHATTGSGGGVYISGRLSDGVVTPANFIMNAGTVSGNDALRVATDEEIVDDYKAAVKLGAGGGIYIQEGHATLGVAGSSEKCEISGNTCGQYGGGIYMTSSVGTGVFSSTLTMNNGVVDGNTAGKRGGGIYMKQSVLTMNGGDVTHNTATREHAGGIDLNNTVFTMTGGNVSWNKAAKRGGGIYYNNVADTGLGDDWKDRDFIFSGGTISHNSAGVDYTNNPGEYDAAKAGEYGGGVCIYTGANGDTNGSKLELSGGTIEYNYAANGGGVYYNGWGCTTLTIENTNIENNTSFIGGGLLAYHGAIKYTSGRIRFNNAKLRPGQTENLTGFTMNHENHCTWDSYDDQVKTNLSGLGGGIFGNSVDLTISGKTFGLYSNLADVAADDLLMNGGVDDYSTTINLPEISDMTIDGFDVPIESLFWAQDYIKDDTGYWNRPVDSTNEVSIDRFRTKLYNIATDIGYIESGKTNNYYRDYICATLGYKLVEVTLKKSGLKPGESAIINLYRKNDVQQSDKPQYQVVLTGNAEGTTVSRKVYLQPGAWTVLESDWSWAYNAAVAEDTPEAEKATVLGRPAIIRTLIDDSSNRVFSFVNAPKENTPPHAEDLKPNEIH
ncbi:MAG: hypothetical protein ACI31F_06805 [Muribaculaceae bacterium]